MLHLDESLLIAEGNQRKCYQHPSDADQCIKISKTTDNRSQHLEHKYYRQLEQRNISWECLCRQYGTTETNLGTGYVFELIRDFDGNISHTISDYLDATIASDVCKEDLLEALKVLKVYVCTQKIMVRNFRLYNFVYQRTSQHAGKAIIIDNIGHHNNFPHLSDHFPFLATRDLKKKWHKFEQKYITNRST